MSVTTAPAAPPTGSSDSHREHLAATAGLPDRGVEHPGAPARGRSGRLGAAIRPGARSAVLRFPRGIAERLAEWTGNGVLLTNTWITVQEVVLGFVFGALAGAVLAYLVAPVRVIWDVISPFVMALYAIPKVALAPLFIVWFGIGIDMKVILAAVSVFFLVFLNTAVGVQEVDRGLIDAVRLMGASRRDVAFKVTLPASMTGLLTGLRVAIPYAVIGAVIGELVASNRGLAS